MRRLAVRYAIAAGAVTAMVIIRLHTVEVLGTRYLLAGMIAPVAVAVWFGGVGPGIFAAVLGYAVARSFFSVPPDQNTLMDLVFSFIFYLIPCVIIIAFGDSRRRLEKALHARALHSEEADRRKNEFIATLSHELRNPLAPLVTDINLLAAMSPSPQHSQALQRMERQVAEIKRLVDDLLDAARVQQGKISLHCERVDLRELIMRCVESTKPVCASTEHSLSTSLPASPVYVHADPVRISQIIHNLVANACKFSPRGTDIELFLATNGGLAELRVKDHGFGIPRDKLETIFEMFTQLNRPGADKSGGLGIGLSLVKRLAELHEGTVEARSDGAAAGSEFIVKLPLNDNPLPS